MKNNKKLIFQYGKVGSTTIRNSGYGKYYPKIQDNYIHDIIQTHNHTVAKDVISKYDNIVVINIIRLPINRNLSYFWENIHIHTPDYKNMTMDEINKKYNKFYHCSNRYLDLWMSELFD